MEKMRIKLEGGILPTYKTEESAGYDLLCPEDTVVPKGRSVISLKIRIALPIGTVGFIRPRSGFSLKGFSNGDEVLEVRFDCDAIDGTLDADYRGIVGVIVYNKAEAFTLHRGTRIAQMVIVPYLHPEMKIVDSLDQTERGEGGFGSTGVN